MYKHFRCQCEFSSIFDPLKANTDKVRMSKKLKGKGKRSTDLSSVPVDNAKKVKHVYEFRMSDQHKEKQLKENLKKKWKLETSSDFKINESIKLIKDPFNCLVVNTLISNDLLLDDLKNELLDQKFVTKNNDLYKFVQSPDLKGKQTSAIEGLKKFLANEVKPWLEEVTDIPLTDTIDMFCAKYEYGDYLLCHDDELEGKTTTINRKSSIYV